jgi:hypothetical protein
MPTIISTLSQAPAETLDYQLDWSAALSPSSDSIASQTVTVVTGPAIVTQTSFGSSASTFWVGKVTAWSVIDVTITTQQGRQFDRRVAFTPA